MRKSTFLPVIALALAGHGSLRASDGLRGDEIRIARASGPIQIDGDLSDPGWVGATRVTTWYETNPGDNIEPKVRNVGYLAYDDSYLYAAFEFSDPEPSKIRAPFGDHDDVGSPTDYGGIILDTRNDHRTGILLLANPRGIQYDAITDDVTGNEDSSPDFYWDSAARITSTGWVLEMRVPFSSLRYSKADPQTWGILLYRNYPRDFRYQMFSAKLPRESNCLMCRANTLAGLEHLPPAGHLIVAPYATLKEEGVPRGDLGTPLVNKPIRGNGGVDAKWTPNENTAVDAAINPDFSQVESDVAQISVNQRFALLYPEKRPFFLEDLELFSTPIQAVYTRSITSPRWGLRATGKFDSNQYTAFVAEDRGGGSVILPGPTSSTTADQDYSSFVGMGRLRRDFGRSFASFLISDREVEGGGYNRVYGPDFQWRAGSQDTVTGQFLLSNTQTPNRPDLSDQWTGQTLNSYAGDVSYSHSGLFWDWYTEFKDFGDDFRADNGFVPQVGYRDNYGETGYTIHPEHFPISRLRTFLIADYQAEQAGDMISRDISPGVGMDGIWSSFTRLRFAFDRIRSGTTTFPRNQFVYQTQFTPSRTISLILIQGWVGDQIDFDNSRPGRGADVNVQATVRPTSHLKLDLVAERSFVNVDLHAGRGYQRLFTADIGRLKATYVFSARSFVRLIGQYVATTRDPSLYISAVNRKDGDFTASALFAYKLNWQSVMFVGYGDERTLTDTEQWAKASRQFFLKVSYAFQK
ncbi:MAG TPA: DUF5916 domain-containing protein [Thermoanaerobaculia bacterium]